MVLKLFTPFTLKMTWINKKRIGARDTKTIDSLSENNNGTILIPIQVDKSWAGKTLRTIKEI